MILLGFRRKLTALALSKSIESAIQWFQIHHRITFATIRNPAVYLSGARVSIFSTLVPRLLQEVLSKFDKGTIPPNGLIQLMRVSHSIRHTWVD